MMRLQRSAVLLALYFCLVSAALPQADTGVITGTIVDASGAAVPNAKVSIVQGETNFHYESVANSEGIYRVQSLLQSKNVIKMPSKKDIHKKRIF